jgi:hypothetical protein
MLGTRIHIPDTANALAVPLWSVTPYTCRLSQTAMSPTPRCAQA